VLSKHRIFISNQILTLHSLAFLQVITCLDLTKFVIIRLVGVPMRRPLIQLVFVPLALVGR